MAEKQPRVTAAGEAKRWLRRYLVRERQSVPPGEAQRLSGRVSRALVSSRAYRSAKTVALFIGFGSEVRTEAIVRDAWRRGKDVLIPITSLGFDKPFFALFRKGDRLVRTSYGPLELVDNVRPFDFRRIDLVAVPGLGFDRDGYRLGYGGGVYDRLLDLTPGAAHVGLFFASQRVNHLPRESHDLPLKAVVTEEGFTAACDLADCRSIKAE